MSGERFGIQMILFSGIDETNRNEYADEEPRDWEEPKITRKKHSGKFSYRHCGVAQPDKT